MAGFCTTYDCMLRNNIKHLHYGKPLRHILTRAEAEYPNVDQIRKKESDRQFKRLLYRHLIHEKACHPVPGAPAFREVPPQKLNQIVTRLHLPTIAHPTKKEPLVSMDLNQQRSRTPRSLRLSHEEEDIVWRVTAPTHASRLRSERDPAIMKKINRPVERQLNISVRFAV